MQQSAGNSLLLQHPLLADSQSEQHIAHKELVKSPVSTEYKMRDQVSYWCLFFYCYPIGYQNSIKHALSAERVSHQSTPGLNLAHSWESSLNYNAKCQTSQSYSKPTQLLQSYIYKLPHTDTEVCATSLLQAHFPAAHGQAVKGKSLLLCSYRPKEYK